MATGLSRSQAEFARLLIQLKNQGGDVVVTIQGKPMARLAPANTVERPRELSPSEKKLWLAELAELRARYSTGKQRSANDRLQEAPRAVRA